MAERPLQELKCKSGLARIVPAVLCLQRLNASMSVQGSYKEPHSYKAGLSPPRRFKHLPWVGFFISTSARRVWCMCYLRTVQRHNGMPQATCVLWLWLTTKPRINHPMLHVSLHLLVS